MADDDSDTQEVDDRFLSEIQELRQDFQEYADSTSQHQTTRRIENIQVLIALSVVGGAISLYAGGFLNSSLWQEQLQSRYWIIILKAFLTANVVFLLLKLTTIPLLPVSQSGLVSFVHDELEPFLYLFAILGVIFSLLVRGISTPVYRSLSIDQRGYLAIVSLILPFVLALGYSQVYRVSAALQRERPLLLEIDHLLDNLVRTGTISAEMQVELMRNIIFVMTPLPGLLVLLERLEDLFSSVFGGTEETTEIFLKINTTLVNALTFGSLQTLTVLNQLNQDFDELLIEKSSGKSELSKQELEEIRTQINQLRNKRAHGELNEEDLIELNEYLERLEREETNDKE